MNLWSLAKTHYAAPLLRFNQSTNRAYGEQTVIAYFLTAQIGFYLKYESQAMKYDFD